MANAPKARRYLIVGVFFGLCAIIGSNVTFFSHPDNWVLLAGSLIIPLVAARWCFWRYEQLRSPPK